VDDALRDACRALAAHLRESWPQGLSRLEVYPETLRGRTGITLYPQVNGPMWELIKATPEGGYANALLDLMRALARPLWPGAEAGRWHFTTSEPLLCATTEPTEMFGDGVYLQGHWLFAPSVNLAAVNALLSESADDPEALQQELARAHPWAQRLLRFPWFNVNTDRHWITIVPVPDQTLTPRDLLISLRAASVGWLYTRQMSRNALKAEAYRHFESLPQAQPIIELL
jgi:hypothetical protein